MIELVLWPGWWEDLKKVSSACILNGLRNKHVAINVSINVMLSRIPII